MLKTGAFDCNLGCIITVRRLRCHAVRTTLKIVLFVVLSAAHAQDFKNASYLSFEYIPGRSSEEYTLKYSRPLDPAPFLAALSTADRVAGESNEAYAVIVEGAGVSSCVKRKRRVRRL